MGSVAASPGFDVYIVLRVLVNSCDDRACLALVDESVARLVGRESAYKTHFALAHANHASPCLAAVNRYPCICKYYVYMLRPWLRLFCWETAQYLGTSVPLGRADGRMLILSYLCSSFSRATAIQIPGVLPGLLFLY